MVRKIRIETTHEEKTSDIRSWHLSGAADKKSQGTRVIYDVCSIPGNYPGFREADQRYEVDTTDKDAILEIAQREKIAGICTAGTDVAIPSVGFCMRKNGIIRCPI